MSIYCPFIVGQRIHEIRGIIVCGWSVGKVDDHQWCPVSPRELDPCAPDAIVTAVTERGFTYEYVHEIPFGRAAWGQMMTGGECFPAGYQYWALVEDASRS